MNRIHHRHHVRRPTQVQGGHRVQDHVHQVVFGQPLTHVHRQQQRLITLRVKEVLRHTP